MKRAIIAVAVLVGWGWVCPAFADFQDGRIITVDDDGPADFNNIQAAIDAADDGDTIIVADGTYTGPGNREIMFLGKAITLRSQNGPDDCVIDGQGSQALFKFIRDELPSSVLDGFTITNGAGSGVFCSESSPTITNCVITNNVRSDGGGLYCNDSSPTIENCIFTGNRASSKYGGAVQATNGGGILRNCVISGNTAAISGGGIWLYNDTMRIENCIITGNVAERDYGGGIYFSESWAQTVNCTILSNSAPQSGGGIHLNRAVLDVTNCIMRANSAPADAEISLSDSFVTGSYSNIEGGYPGSGNIDSDPCFADPCNGDYHLKSESGRWNSIEEDCVADEVTSPCIDAGRPMSPIGFEPFPNGGRINMGAYGGTPIASKSYFSRPPCQRMVAGDINGDCTVDFLDFQIMSLCWLAGEETLNSKCKIEDGVEYCLETDDFTYHAGRPIAMLYRLTNLSDRNVEFILWNMPGWNFWVDKNGADVWSAVTVWWTTIDMLELRPSEKKEYIYIWNAKDSRGNLVAPGRYDLTGGLDAGTEGYGDYDFTKVAVTINLEP